MKASHRYACALGALTLVLNSAARADDMDRDRDRDRRNGPSAFVDCGAGDTIARALSRGDERKSLVISIQGSCSENILVSRSDVTLLAAAPGATVIGPDPTVDTIRVTGSRVTIDGLTVTGGRNGVAGDGAAGLAVRNAAVQSTGRSGVIFIQGTSGLVDSSTVTGNPRDGVAIDSATGVVVNSQISQNGRMGVGVFNSGSGRIGIDSANNAGGNTISANAVNGVHIVFGSAAVVGMNQIMGNGVGAAGGTGINVVSASADIVGGNTVSGNNGTGINLRSSSALIGDANFGLTTVNTVSGNGTAASQGGVSGFLGSSMSIRDAVITGNFGFGLIATTRSSIQIQSTTIQNNLPVGASTGDGIRVVLGSALFAQTPNGVVTGNAGFGLLCTDAESSVVNTLFLGIGPNGLGIVSPGCTGF